MPKTRPSSSSFNRRRRRGRGEVSLLRLTALCVLLGSGAFAISQVMWDDPWHADRAKAPAVESEATGEPEKNLANRIVAAAAGILRSREEAQPIAERPPEPPVIVVDPGHGGVDGGTVANGMVERDWSLKIGLALRDELERRGHRVVMTRDTDVSVTLADRSRAANRRNARAFVSVHLNAADPSVEGVETFFSDPKSLQAARDVRARLGIAAGSEVADERAERLALAVQEKVCAATDARSRGIKNRADLAVTRRTSAPSILIECGFLTNAAEAERIKNAEYRLDIARGIADGVEEFLRRVDEDPLYGITITPAGPEPPDPKIADSIR